MKQRRIWVVLGLGAALSLTPVGLTAAQAADFASKPVIRDVDVQAAHIPRLPE